MTLFLHIICMMFVVERTNDWGHINLCNFSSISLLAHHLVENPLHSDFTKLRNMLISTHFADLNETTQEVHYENFRAQCIAQMTENVKSGKCRSDSIKTPTGDIVVPMVTETDKLLLQKEEEIRRMQEMLAEMQEKLKQQTVDV